jgi:hypothetical protein
MANQYPIQEAFGRMAIPVVVTITVTVTQLMGDCDPEEGGDAGTHIAQRSGRRRSNNQYTLHWPHWWPCAPLS